MPGEVLQIEVRAVLSEVERSLPFRRLLVSYQAAFHAQVSQSVACNGLHPVGKRCCRWLLMTHDRVGSDLLPLTHEFLSLMLGVRRASVTDVLGPLRNRGAHRLHTGLHHHPGPQGHGGGSMRVLSRRQG